MTGPLDTMVPVSSYGEITGYYDLNSRQIVPVAMVRTGPAPSWAEAITSLSAKDAHGNWVYFLGDPLVAIKIGKTGAIQKRLRDMQIGSPIKLTLLAKIPGSCIVEQAYHSRFAEHRLHGEWFAPHPDILAEIERLSTQETTHDR